MPDYFGGSVGAIVKVDKRHYRKIAQENWGLTDAQMEAMDVHHRIPQSRGGTNDPSNLYVCSRWFHAYVWHAGGTLKNYQPWIAAVCTDEARAKSWKTRKENWSAVCSAGGRASAKARKERGEVWQPPKLTSEQYSAHGRIAAYTLFKCPECGMIANAGNITRHMKAKGHNGEKIKC